MQSYILRIAARVVLCLALIAPAAIVQARTISALGARPVNPTDASCFAWFPLDTSVPGLEQKNCGFATIDFAMPVDFAGRKFVVVQAARRTADAVLTCQAFSVTNSGGFTGGNPVDFTGAAGDEFSPLRLPSIFVSPGGTLWVRCSMAQGTRILGIDLINP